MNSEIYLIIGIVVLATILFLMVLMLFAKILKKFGSYYSGFQYRGIRKVIFNFSYFNAFIDTTFFVRPNVPYEVVYFLETTEGEVSFRIGDYIKKSTTDCLEGSEIVEFNKSNPTLTATGNKACNGRCRVQLYRKK